MAAVLAAAMDAALGVLSAAMDAAVATTSKCQDLCKPYFDKKIWLSAFSIYACSYLLLAVIGVLLGLFRRDWTQGLGRGVAAIFTVSLIAPIVYLELFFLACAFVCLLLIDLGKWAFRTIRPLVLEEVLFSHFDPFFQACRWLRHYISADLRSQIAKSQRKVSLQWKQWVRRPPTVDGYLGYPNMVGTMWAKWKDVFYLFEKAVNSSPDAVLWDVRYLFQPVPPNAADLWAEEVFHGVRSLVAQKLLSDTTLLDDALRYLEGKAGVRGFQPPLQMGQQLNKWLRMNNSSRVESEILKQGNDKKTFTLIAAAVRQRLNVGAELGKDGFEVDARGLGRLENGLLELTVGEIKSSEDSSKARSQLILRLGFLVFISELFSIPASTVRARGVIWISSEKTSRTVPNFTLQTLVPGSQNITFQVYSVVH